MGALGTNELYKNVRVVGTPEGYQESVYMKFISGEMKFFHFGVWSISYNSLHEIPQNEIQCGCNFIAVILTEMKFHIE